MAPETRNYNVVMDHALMRKAACARAVMLPRNARFRLWAVPLKGGESRDRQAGIEAATQFIRDCCCKGASRRLIETDSTCYERFLEMEAQYLSDTNQMAEVSE